MEQFSKWKALCRGMEAGRLSAAAAAVNVPHAAAYAQKGRLADRTRARRSLENLQHAGPAMAMAMAMAFGKPAVDGCRRPAWS